MGRPFRAPVLLALLLPACGGGGGGGPVAPPLVGDLVAATWLGAGATPQAGDTLQLFFNTDVNAAVGRLFTDADARLASGTLGAVSSQPVQVNPRTLAVPLGTGVSFAPGTTTIELLAGNDVVLDSAARLLGAGTAVTITTGDAEAPVISNVTASGVDDLLNGTGPAGGTLQVPRSGFTIGVAATDSGAGVLLSGYVVHANVAVSVNGALRPVGANLTDVLQPTNLSGEITFPVPPEVVFPVGPLTITAYARDLSGRVANPMSFAFRVGEMTAAVRPFRTTVNPRQVWFLSTARDIEGFTVNLANGTTPVEVNPGANGRGDLDDLLLVLGLHSPTPLANVIGNLDSNQVVTSRLQTTIVSELALLYSGANVAFTFTAPGTFPPGASSVPYDALGFSQIAIAGSETAAGTSGVLGVAIFDPNNKTQDDNTRTDFAGSQRLGVFLHTLVNSGFRTGSLSTFRLTFDLLTPARGGTPIGNDPQDAQRLQGTLSDLRRSRIDNAILRLARFTAVVAAHECGHSVGLVQDDPMPRGLYGGDGVNFPGSTVGHIRMPLAAFPSGTQNVMAPAVDFDAALSAGTRFNSLNSAYLREQAFYDQR